MEGGVVKMDSLRRELITRIELEAAAHKQGFASLDEIDRAILDPGGSICFFPKDADARQRASRRADGQG